METEVKEDKIINEPLEWSRNLPLGRYLSLISRNFFGVIIKRLEHLGLDSNYSILILLDDNDKDCSQQFLCDYLNIDKASMVRKIDCLVEKGLIERVNNPADRREYHIKLTAAAHVIMPEIHEAINETNYAVLNGLSDEEREAFYYALKVLYSNVRKMPSHSVVFKYEKKIKSKTS